MNWGGPRSKCHLPLVYDPRLLVFVENAEKLSITRLDLQTAASPPLAPRPIMPSRLVRRETLFMLGSYNHVLNNKECEASYENGESCILKSD